jgi:hypothetical protein
MQVDIEPEDLVIDRICGIFPYDLYLSSFKNVIRPSFHLTSALPDRVGKDMTSKALGVSYLRRDRYIQLSVDRKRFAFIPDFPAIHKRLKW